LPIGSREKALLAVEAGCDFVIAQGIKAGGHIRGTIGLLPLLGEVLDAVPLHVLAAGWIGTGRAMAAALAAGTDAVRVGTCSSRPRRPAHTHGISNTCGRTGPGHRQHRRLVGRLARRFRSRPAVQPGGG